jgi:hypothetical protein
MTTLEKLEWALMTLTDKLTFGMDESEAVYRRESRCKGVLVDVIDEIKALEAKLKVAVEALEDISLRTSSWESNPAAVALKKIKGEK